MDTSELLVVTPGEKQNGDVSKQYQNREDLEKAYNEAKVSEAQLADSEARLQTIIDMVPSFLWTSRPDGSKEYLNKRWYDYTGLSLEEGQGWGWKVVVHPEDLDRLVRDWLAVMDSRKPGELETRIRRYDGVYRWFLIRVVPLLDEQGNVVKWFGSNTDIEDRKRAEEKLRQDERELRQRQGFCVNDRLLFLGRCFIHLNLLAAVGAVGTVGKRSLFFHGFHSPVFLFLVHSSINSPLSSPAAGSRR